MSVWQIRQQSLGIPEDAYLAMSSAQRDRAKKWLKENSEKTFDDWKLTGKTATAAAKYKLTVEEWTALTRGEKKLFERMDEQGS